MSLARERLQGEREGRKGKGLKLERREGGITTAYSVHELAVTRSLSHFPTLTCTSSYS